MYTFEMSIYVNRPQQQVFEFVSNPANATQWQSTTISSKWKSEGSPGVGSRIQSVMKIWGQPIEGEAEITDWEPFSMYAFKASTSSFQVAGKLRFESKENGTQIILNGQVKGVGFFRLLEGIAGRQTEKQDTRNYQALKALLESS